MVAQGQGCTSLHRTPDGVKLVSKTVDPWRIEHAVREMAMTTGVAPTILRASRRTMHHLYPDIETATIRTRWGKMRVEIDDRLPNDHVYLSKE